jgi:hypothetical protein
MRSEWIKSEIAQGIEDLQFLSLERQPAAASLHRTVDVWAAAVDSHQRWSEDSDRQRLRSAFLELARVRRSWPAPADLLAVLARREAIDPPQGRRADPRTAARAAARVAQLLEIKPDQQRVGKMAAAGPDA